MPNHRVSADRHNAIFGKPTATGKRVGRRRYYINRHTDEITLRGTEGHNLLEPLPPANRDLSSPQIAPTFQEHVAGDHRDPVVIGDRSAKRDYMERNGLAEYDEGVGHRNEWVEERQNMEDIVDTVKMAMERDPLSLEPWEKPQRLDEKGSLAEGTEIDTGNMEIVE